jgi:hypothetical protein
VKDKFPVASSLAGLARNRTTEGARARLMVTNMLISGASGRRSGVVTAKLGSRRKAFAIETQG